MRIGVDVMGGDGGPGIVVAGSVDSCRNLGDDDQLILVGDREEIEKNLGEHEGYPEDKIDVCHSEQVIGMGESPVVALKKKPASSIALLADMQKEGKVDACVSAGNTGACVAAAHMKLGMLECVQRPGIAVTSPAFGNPVSICDVGANVNCRPQNLYEYAVMTSIYFERIFKTETPRIGLLSVGEEEGKGNELVKASGELLREDPDLNFIGNVESRDILRGVCDVLICEGFVGNVVLKLMEGLGEDIVAYFLDKVAAAAPRHFEKFKKLVDQIHSTYDFNDYGGAPLLGVDGIWFICHGASTARGIMNAIRTAADFSHHHINRLITQRLGRK